MTWKTRYYQLLDSLQRRNRRRQGRERRERQPRQARPGRAEVRTGAVARTPVQRPVSREPRVRTRRIRVPARTR
jgi:hypothetical protein